MKITHITISAGRTFNHPFESYSNLRPHVQLDAELDDGDDVTTCIKELQAKAEGFVEDHKQHMLKSLQNLQEMQSREREIIRLESLIKASQDKLQSYRDNPIENLPSLLFADKTRCEDCGHFEESCQCEPL